MDLTRDFRETIRERAEREPAFREALFAEGVECLLSGDVRVGEAILRDYLATVRSDSPGSPRQRR